MKGLRLMFRKIGGEKQIPLAKALSTMSQIIASARGLFSLSHVITHTHILNATTIKTVNRKLQENKVVFQYTSIFYSLIE